MSAGWSVSSVAELVEILDSRRIPVNAEERSQRFGDVPYFGATGQVGWIDDFLFDEELILLGEDGAPFLEPHKPKAYVVRGRSWVNNHAHVLRVLGDIPAQFVVHQLNILNYQPYVTGSTRLKLPQAPMRTIPLLVAPLAEQRRIVAALEEHLSELDAAVAGLERARASTRQLRSSMLRTAFDWSGASGETQESPDEWGPTVPAHWKWIAIEDLSELVEYGTSAKTGEDEAGIPVLRMGNIVEGRLEWDSLKFLPANHSEFPKLLLQDGDLLFNRTNSPELVGKCAVYRDRGTVASFASYLLRIRLKFGVLPDLVASYINSMFGRAWVGRVVTQQVGQANVNGSKLRALRIPIPPLAEQQAIVSRLEELSELSRRTERELEHQLLRAARLRQSILKAAFEGTLVPQDPNDEPASVLLERIRAEQSAASAMPKRIRRATTATKSRR